MNEPSTKASCPYKSFSKSAYWRDTVANQQINDVDPVLAPRFRIERNTKVGTAGSCFAQHIARYLKREGSNYFVVEPGHPKLSDAIRAAYNYGVFSARFGNIYTTRQLVQLFDRAHGNFIPKEEPWRVSHYLIDPFRPAIQPNGFASSVEFEVDRGQHFAAVRRMFSELDVFVFTMGLTEGWVSQSDGAALPVCPGCGAGGTFDPTRYRFVNETVADVITNLRGFIERLKAVNPTAKILLTVSPVPLVATASGQNVLSATTYSKSVLRAAAGEIYNEYSHVDYFPSYEIITGSYTRGAYFSDDLRTIKEAGVAHVMRLMLRHYLGIDLTNQSYVQKNTVRKGLDSREIAKIVCEEELLQHNNSVQSLK